MTLTTVVSISKSVKLRRSSPITIQFISSSFIWELKVFIVSSCLSTENSRGEYFQTCICSYRIFNKIYVLYFLSHRTPILQWPVPSLNQWINVVHWRAGAESRLQHNDCIFLLELRGGDMFKFNICVAVFLVKFSSTILKQCPLHFNNTQTFWCT